MKGIVRHEPGFLGRSIDTEQEHTAEKIQRFGLVPGDPADEHWLVITGQDFF
jgi:hypothetical protein